MSSGSDTPIAEEKAAPAIGAPEPMQDGETCLVPLSVDVVAGASALAATLGEDAPVLPRSASRPSGAAALPYVLYERQGEILFAAGATVELTMDRSGLHIGSSRGSERIPLSDRPLEQVRATLARLAETGILPKAPWRAYGWAAFELSYLLHGLPVPDDAGTLLHLVVPRHEVRLRPGTAEFRVPDDALARLWKQALRDAPADLTAERVRVDEISDAGGYRDAAAAAIRDIDGIRLRKVILSRSISLADDVDIVATYRALRHNNTPARSFLLRLGGLSAAGVSPTAIIEVSPTGTVATTPLAGTRALTGRPDADAVLREELLSDPKEIYEHALSVKLAQDELEQVCRPGSVAVEGFMQVVARGSVQHLASRVRGQLAPDASGWDAFASVFPAVTASGIPKREACAAIGKRERGRRGLYSGAVLMIESDGALDAALVLRSVFQSGGLTWLRAGAGLIMQSDADRELEETREKLRSVSRFLVPRAGAAS